MEIGIVEYDVNDYIKNNGYTAGDFDDEDNKCRKVYAVVDVDSGRKSRRIGCLMESGSYWVVGAQPGGLVQDYAAMIKEIISGGF